MKNEYTYDGRDDITDSSITFDVAIDSFPDEADAIIDALYPDGKYYDQSTRVFVEAVWRHQKTYDETVGAARKVAANWKPE